MFSPSRRFLLGILLVATVCFAGCSEEPNPALTGTEAAAVRTDLKSIPPGYYDTVDESTPEILRSSVHAVIDDHVKISYTSSATDTWNVLEVADEDPNDSGRILDVYLNASYQKWGAGNTDYNREHTWPSSYGFPNDGSTNYPYTDCHHLFLCNDSRNSSRGNKPYGAVAAAGSEYLTEVNNGVGGGAGTYPGWSNWADTVYWETWWDRRGDVARGLLYLDVRYEGGTHGVTGVSEPDLILTDNLSLIESSNTGSNLGTAYMGLLSVLLQWHQDDPVDAKETARNDAVYSFQGNRNPFVDHPEWVDCIFGADCGGAGDTTPPEAPAGLSGVAGDGSIDLNWNDNLEADLAGYSVYRATVSGGPYSAATGSLLGISQFIDSSLDNGTTYYYVVTASDVSGNESAGSTETASTPAGGGGGAEVWINEFHYDNDGTDTGEFFEVAGPAGTALSGWSVVAYNGNGGVVYDTEVLGGTLPDQDGGYGTLAFSMVGMQNGSPDGLALVDGGGAVVQFISYEGAITATDGPALGLTSSDIGVSESSDSPVGWSLQQAGFGTTETDFGWQPAQAGTPGVVNTGQVFDGGPVNEVPVAEANGPYSGAVGETITFNSSGSYDNDGGIAAWDWDFGDGGVSTAANPTHIYTAPGSYLVTLTVTDDQDATDVDTAVADALDTIAPAAPVGLAAAAGDGTVDLDWVDNGESDLVGYVVYRATATGGPYAAVSGLVGVSAYLDNSVSNGTVYFYVVTAFDGADNESSISAETSALPSGEVGGAPVVWLNEFHYDNDGTDTGEFFEIAGPVGTSLSDWSVVAYNGNGGVVYDTEVLSGTLPDQEDGLGTLAFAMVGMQNGSPDALALVNGDGTVVQFLSYEGVVIATDGVAVGLTSTDINVSEPADSPLGWTLQLAGQGTSYADFSWEGPTAGTMGGVNSNQIFGIGAAQQLVHVESIAATSVVISRKEYGEAEVTVADAQGAPVAGVTVIGTFSGGLRGTYSAVTGTDGIAVVANDKGGKIGLSFTFCVNDLLSSGWTYDSSANVVTCAGN